MSKGHNPSPTSSSPALPPTPVATETGPWVSHRSSEPVPDGAQFRLARNGISLSARSSFQGFSSEEDGGAPERYAEQRSVGPELPALRTNGFPTPDGISAQGSFQAFSDEEMDEIQPILGDQNHDQLPDYSSYDSAHNLNPIRPRVSFAPAIVRPEPFASVSAGPLSNAEGGFRAATQGRWDSLDIATTSKLKHEVFVERNRRVKFGGERPFTPQHRPFPPRTPKSATSHEVPRQHVSTTRPVATSTHAGFRSNSPLRMGREDLDRTPRLSSAGRFPNPRESLL
jgi:hypothetical protein